jgi:FAD/FMN-containing dehydrogenase
VELMLLMSRHVFRVQGPGIQVIAPVFADSWREAQDAVAFLTHSPLRSSAALRLPFIPSGLPLLYRAVMQHYPDNHRYAVDNMWTGANIDALLPGLTRIAETLPPAPSHVLWMNWTPPRERPDMAYSMEDNSYIALYSVWKEAKDDARFAAWPVEHMRAMAHLASGCQLADENLGQRPARFVTDAHLARLDQVRAARDPENRFHSWMGRPTS